MVGRIAVDSGVGAVVARSIADIFACDIFYVWIMLTQKCPCVGYGTVVPDDNVGDHRRLEAVEAARELSDVGVIHYHRNR